MFARLHRGTTKEKTSSEYKADTSTTGESEMNRSLFWSFLAISAAWALYWKSRSAPYQVVPASVAAARLRKAWANNHTTA
jgi:hypothetical protein